MICLQIDQEIEPERGFELSAVALNVLTPLLAWFEVARPEEKKHNGLCFRSV